jgi:hypothetical protein
VPDGPDDSWLHLALIADAYERGGWPAPDGRIRPVAALREPWLAVPLLDGTWRRDTVADPTAHAHVLGHWAMVATTARAGPAGLVTFRRVPDRRFGEVTVSAASHPRRIVVCGPGLPTVEITRHGPGEDVEPADPIGTRRPGHLGLVMNSRPGVLLPARSGSGRAAYDVDAVAWSRQYRLRQSAPDQAEVVRNGLRVARLLRGDPAPDRRYAIGWELAADAVDRAMVHALASAFRIGATTFGERVRARRARQARLAPAATTIPTGAAALLLPPAADGPAAGYQPLGPQVAG